MEDKYAIEYVEGNRIKELWPDIEPMVQRSCEGNAISRGNLSADEIRDAVLYGMCIFFVYYEDRVPTCILAIEISMQGKYKIASILALGGKNLTTFKRLYWKAILDWLRSNDVNYVDAVVDSKYASVYLNKFGFEQQASLVRMSLSEV